MNLRLSSPSVRCATVTLASGTVFEASPDETILQAAFRAGIWLPSACRTGACGSCRARISRGDFQHIGPTQALSAAQRDRGTALLCRAHATGDLRIDIAELPEPPPSERPAVPARVIGLVRENEQVMRLTLRLPPLDRLEFIPGQFVCIRHAGGFDRSFSIANAPRQDGTIELHVGRVSGGAFTGHVFDHLQLNDILHVSGPFGNFTLAAEPRASIFIAGGTGIAPVRAILEKIAAGSFHIPVVVYWGSRASSGFYLDRELLEFSSTYGIGYIPVISGCDKTWAGRTGLVHEAVLQDFGDLSGFDIYACGNPAMVGAARDAACCRGASPDRFFSDSFYPSGSAADSRLDARKESS